MDIALLKEAARRQDLLAVRDILEHATDLDYKEFRLLVDDTLRIVLSIPENVEPHLGLVEYLLWAGASPAPYVYDTKYDRHDFIHQRVFRGIALFRTWHYVHQLDVDFREARRYLSLFQCSQARAEAPDFQDQYLALLRFAAPIPEALLQKTGLLARIWELTKLLATVTYSEAQIQNLRFHDQFIALLQYAKELPETRLKVLGLFQLIVETATHDADHRIAKRKAQTQQRPLLQTQLTWLQRCRKEVRWALFVNTEDMALYPSVVVSHYWEIAFEYYLYIWPLVSCVEDSLPVESFIQERLLATMGPEFNLPSEILNDRRLLAHVLFYVPRPRIMGTLNPQHIARWQTMRTQYFHAFRTPKVVASLMFDPMMIVFQSNFENKLQVLLDAAAQLRPSQIRNTGLLEVLKTTLAYERFFYYNPDLWLYCERESLPKRSVTGQVARGRQLAMDAMRLPRELDGLIASYLAPGEACLQRERISDAYVFDVIGMHTLNGLTAEAIATYLPPTSRATLLYYFVTGEKGPIPLNNTDFDLILTRYLIIHQKIRNALGQVALKKRFELINIAVMNDIIKKGFDIDTWGPGRSLVWLATYHRQEGYLHFLIDNGANLEGSDEFQSTLAHCIVLGIQKRQLTISVLEHCRLSFANDMKFIAWLNHAPPAERISALDDAIESKDPELSTWLGTLAGDLMPLLFQNKIKKKHYVILIRLAMQFNPEDRIGNTVGHCLIDGVCRGKLDISLLDTYWTFHPDAHEWLNKKNDEGISPLDIAKQYGPSPVRAWVSGIGQRNHADKCIEYFIRHQLDPTFLLEKIAIMGQTEVNAKRDGSKTGLEWAFEASQRDIRYIDVIVALLKRGARLSDNVTLGHLIQLALRAEHEGLRILPRLHLFNNQDSRGNTALHFAINNRDIDLAKYVVEHWPRILTIANHNGDTPLHLAIKRNDLNPIFWLIRQKANIMCFNDDNKTPIHLMVEHLLQLDTEANSQQHPGVVQQFLLDVYKQRSGERHDRSWSEVLDRCVVRKLKNGKFFANPNAVQQVLAGMGINPCRKDLRVLLTKYDTQLAVARPSN